jgi:transposase-like protein
VAVEQIAKDFGVHPMTLFKWLRQADIDEGVKPGGSGSDSAELREARKRIKLLEQENEVLRRAAAYLSQANLPGKALPARERARRRRDPRGGDVPGIADRSTALLPVACPPDHQG